MKKRKKKKKPCRERIVPTYSKTPVDFKRLWSTPPERDDLIKRGKISSQLRGYFGRQPGDLWGEAPCHLHAGLRPGERAEGMRRWKGRWKGRAPLPPARGEAPERGRGRGKEEGEREAGRERGREAGEGGPCRAERPGLLHLPLPPRLARPAPLPGTPASSLRG